IASALTGIRGRDGRTRSPATGFGAKLTLRSGLHEQTRLYTGLNGGPDQSWLPEVFGLGGATNADYLHILWPDGVAQDELDLAAGTTHKFSELQRKISSCPVLFAWNGERFGFVTDFAGVGGLGYFAAPGEYSQPQVEEHVKIEPGQLVPKDGAYELRITEPMEEVAYVDRLELLAIDHPAAWSVFPDERLAITGPKPTHDLLVVADRFFPVHATAPDGSDATARLRTVDRQYAYEPDLDRRFIGFCRPHTLELDYGDQLAVLDRGEHVFLFINGFIEYPYSSTVYGASQAGVGWESIRIDADGMEGAWQTIVPDAGVPGGMARMFTVDLTGRLRHTRRLRLTTNLELCYDQIFIARVLGPERVTVHRLAPGTADFRRVGFALEHSPDGQLPWVYDYERSEPTAPFQVQRGPYTRYGPVTELLQDYDDRYVMVGPGDEIAVRFEAAQLTPPHAGMTRSFVLVSHAYCKDMDLYTATPETVEPLPFRGMSRYPYPESEHFPDTPSLREWKQTYNTRHVSP
ncbi:MAG: ASPIC/UnbV domain-containing protein, partial [Verrucomicrobiae bacterium]|nr:ASPIC/UnbV domain-containing protein [Verrucomicrobiae bacterium]